MYRLYYTTKSLFRKRNFTFCEKITILDIFKKIIWKLRFSVFLGQHL